MTNAEAEYQETTHVFQDYQGGVIDSLETITLLQNSDHSVLFPFLDAYRDILVPSVHTSTVSLCLLFSSLGVISAVTPCVN